MDLHFGIMPNNAMPTFTEFFLAHRGFNKSSFEHFVTAFVNVTYLVNERTRILAFHFCKRYASHKKWCHLLFCNCQLLVFFFGAVPAKFLGNAFAVIIIRFLYLFVRYLVLFKSQYGLRMYACG